MDCARDIMTKNPITIPTSMEISSVVELFLKENVTSAPVVTTVHELVGVMTDLQLTRIYLKARSSKYTKVAFYESDLVEPCFVGESSTLTEVIRVMVRAPSHRALVVDGNKKLVGIVSPKDLLKNMAGYHVEKIDLRDELEQARQKIEKLSVQLEDTKAIMKHYERIYLDSPTMMHSVNEKGHIVMANNKIHDVLGYKKGELLKLTIFDLYPNTCHAAAYDGLKKIVEHGQSQVAYTSMVKKSGEVIRVDLVSSALKSSDGRFIGTITASRQISSEALLRALHGALTESTFESTNTSSSEDPLEDKDDSEQTEATNTLTKTGRVRSKIKSPKAS